MSCSMLPQTSRHAFRRRSWRGPPSAPGSPFRSRFNGLECGPEWRRPAVAQAGWTGAALRCSGSLGLGGWTARAPPQVVRPDDEPDVEPHQKYQNPPTAKQIKLVSLVLKTHHLYLHKFLINFIVPLTCTWISLANSLSMMTSSVEVGIYQTDFLYQGHC